MTVTNTANTKPLFMGLDMATGADRNAVSIVWVAPPSEIARELAEARREIAEARREAAIANVQLSASMEREKMLVEIGQMAAIRADAMERLVSDQDITIRELRRELLEAHDVAGRAEGAAMAKPVPVHDWARVVTGDRRMLGG